jgi:phosphoribosyl-ATP pyrophosphohydrolase/phosphoribosyl-AMP cyclohydrolase/histidinol dehydrogenase
MEKVRDGGEAELARLAAELDGNAVRLWYGPDDFKAALAALPAADRAALERAAGRIEDFARAQLSCLSPLSMAISGGRAGHELVPVERAGCYAPGGRFPLPSSVLMTALVARVAGVGDVTVACPRPEPSILAACALADAGLLLAAGGAQAIAAFAYGAGRLSARDLIVGPGNRYVAAAKLQAQALVRTDAPAGPSELLILSDGSADPRTLAWDLLAQAEHDPDALACLACTDEAGTLAVEAALAAAMKELRAISPASADNAASALSKSWAFSCARGGGSAGASAEETLAEAANRFAPEHLELALAEPERVRGLIRHAGALFIGERSAEVFGDYGAGPNHALPTAGRSRSSGGLSVFDFLRVRSWLYMDGGEGAEGLARDTMRLADMEGLAAHARSARARLPG